LTGRSSKSYIGMQSAKSGVSRVLGLPAKLISVPKATIRGCHVLTVTIGRGSEQYLLGRLLTIA
jgi:hypothetical protein